MDDVGGSCCPALARPLVDTLWHPTVSVQKSRCLPASRFNDLEGCKQGCMYLPDNIGERPWPMALLQSLAAGLRKMAGELDSSDKGGLAMSNVVEFPTTEKPITEDEIDKLHSGAFRDLESGISDCVHNYAAWHGERRST